MAKTYTAGFGKVPVSYSNFSKRQYYEYYCFKVVIFKNNNVRFYLSMTSSWTSFNRISINEFYEKYNVAVFEDDDGEKNKDFSKHIIKIIRQHAMVGNI